MQIRIFLTAFLITTITLIQAQVPTLDWQSCFGGTNHEVPESICETSDRGVVVAGYSMSNNGDVTENQGLYDWWIFKLDPAHNLLWQRSLGGTKDDFAYSVISTADGNVLCGGSTRSNDGDVSGNHGNFDCWLTKMDSLGNVIWSKCYGGTQYDELKSLIQTTDGGYIFSGRSHSNNGDVSGHHGTAISSDAWVVKIDAAGNIEWQRSYGGTDWDYSEDIIQTAEGYVFTGYASSNDGDANASHPVDYWIVKIDLTGNIIWSKTYGGSNSDNANSLIQLADGNFIVAGTSYSWNGDVTGHHGTDLSNGDVWVLKLDANGNIVWKKSYGGLSIELGNEVIDYDDDLFLVTGYAQSIDGDLSSTPSNDGNVWTLAINKVSGVMEWYALNGGSVGTEYGRTVCKTSYNGFIFGAIATTNNDLITTAHGFNDFWIFTWTPDCIAVTETCNLIDDDCDGLIDNGIIETINISADGATTFCQGNSVLLSATYSGASIQWKKNGTNIPGATSSAYSANKTGNYTAVTTSPCGTATSSIINVTVNKNPSASITAGGATTFCAGGSVILTANAGGGLSYQWYKGASLLVGATSINYTATTAGNYKCRVTKTATGCFKNSNVISVTVPCKEGEELMNEQNNNFTIFPNPNNGTFNLLYDCPTGSIYLTILNSLGQQIFYKQINSTNGIINETISINNLSSGIYFVKLYNENNYSEQKLIIE
ncbi:MAG: T9SS type A sorting domain-containing protein [Bacteroidetes bacterium]|jgi:hypothetical protein|nr:T9SS type A sorting domain-containing protein [Bacteroidota bacterium]MBP8915212.1 T9SS type A sorting domain-containing protein [Chitinophagales bacterium]